MIDAITQMAALVSTSLNKVDRDMLSTGSAGPANKINVYNFVKQPDKPALPQRELVAPLPDPVLIPAPTPVITSTSAPIQSNIALTDLNRLIDGVEKIATEIGKINKKMTSVQRYLNGRNNELIDSESRK